MANSLKLTTEFYVETALLAITLYCLCRLILLKRKKNLPPGPIGLPFLGYLPFLGKEPHKALAKLKQKYGNIIGFNLGSQYIVFLNEYNIMKETLSHSAAMDRSNEIFADFNMGFGTSNGMEWQEQRKFCLKTMRDLGLGKGPWGKLTRESTHDFIQKLHSFKGQPAEIDQLLINTLGTNIISLLLGRKLDPVTEKEIIKAAEVFPIAFSHYGPTVLGSLIPGFRKFCIYFRLLGYDTAKEQISSFYDMAKKEIEKHRLIHDKDFINIYEEKAKQLNTADVPHFFSDENLKGNLAILVLGGSETTTNSLQYLTRLMAKYPKIQEKVQKELDEVIGKDGTITFEDRHKVPYTFAVMREAQRYCTIFPLSSMRKATVDFEIGGYTIPKGSALIANQWAVNFDPNCYKDPKIFRPERFLVKGESPDVIAFTFGKRKCPGETIAWMVILTFFSVLMQKFTISVPPGVQLNFDGYGGFSSRLKPQILCFKERTGSK